MALAAAPAAETSHAPTLSSQSSALPVDAVQLSTIASPAVDVVQEPNPPAPGVKAQCVASPVDATQASPVCVPYLPGKQLVHSEPSDDASWPTAQVLQLVAECSSWYSAIEGSHISTAVAAEPLTCVPGNADMQKLFPSPGA